MGIFSMILSLLSGVALFLFGMSLMGDGLKMVAGNKLEAFLNLLKDYEILELARTGITGLSRGSKDVAFF